MRKSSTGSVQELATRLAGRLKRAAQRKTADDVRRRNHFARACGELEIPKRKGIELEEAEQHKAERAAAPFFLFLVPTVAGAFLIATARLPPLPLAFPQSFPRASSHPPPSCRGQVCGVSPGAFSRRCGEVAVGCAPTRAGGWRGAAEALGRCGAPRRRTRTSPSAGRRTKPLRAAAAAAGHVAATHAPRHGPACFFRWRWSR
ncbi:uncharacterized protein Tco025E_08075 [Trypanosoma conorhini]|uniref:Uncharacterized protein n=1 Tax=Trypanosoma conorhini TaxID=83891 RepID=A0A422NEQ4_9TRYP|nr:uncharacterized protein Tco025E_08075 [Trypanosoma conorhini]RNF03937.1 hypothetical protein Tco025E_08075 [Trypanosoma conorhini]